MSLVQKLGKPDLFITMTCNAAWPEITEQMVAGETAQNRPDLVSRVFRAKLLTLKKKILNEHVFGEVAAFIYVVEFQKRGLPHAHFLIILKPQFKLKSPSDFDKFVCAEIPTVECPILRKSVLRHMMHGPCGAMNPQCQCMKHPKTMDRCKYGFTKNFCDATSNNAEGYPLYRRPNSGESAIIRKHRLDNRWAVKYLYKYVYKGHDRTSFSVCEPDQGGAVDEIDQYQSGRWVSPCEAAWRIYGFDLFEMHPSVMPMPIHLPNMQSLQMRPHEQLDAVAANEKRTRTALTEFFRVNSENPEIRLLYGDFTDSFRWDKDKKKAETAEQSRSRWTPSIRGTP
ncbi:hypothetical protein vseg_016257 [Gypsophila vaccaria]